jgi:hypothetical protein
MNVDGRGGKKTTLSPGCNLNTTTKEPTGYIKFEKFAVVLLRVIINKEIPRDEDEKMYRAFMVWFCCYNSHFTIVSTRLWMSTRKAT